MWNYYVSLVLSTPKILLDSLRTVEGIVALVGFTLLLWQPKLGRRLLSWHKISRWWALAPIALLFLYGVLRANYERFAIVAEELAQISEERPVLAYQSVQVRTEQDDEETRYRLRLELKNTGEREATDVVARFAMMREGQPDSFQTLRESALAQPIRAEEFALVRFPDIVKVGEPKDIVLGYVGITYHNRTRVFLDEWWLRYEVSSNSVGIGEMRDRKELEPFIRKEYGLPPPTEPIRKEPRL